MPQLRIRVEQGKNGGEGRDKKFSTNHPFACFIENTDEKGVYIYYSFLKLCIMGIIWYILIGIVAGFIAGKLMRGGGFGIIVNLIVGIIGGVLGGWVFGLLGFHTTSILGSLVTSVIGAVLFLWILSFFQRPKVDA